MGKKEEAAARMADAVEEHGEESDEAYKALKDFVATSDDSPDDNG